MLCHSSTTSPACEHAEHRLDVGRAQLSSSTRKRQLHTWNWVLKGMSAPPPLLARAAGKHLYQSVDILQIGSYVVVVEIDVAIAGRGIGGGTCAAGEH